MAREIASGNLSTTESVLFTATADEIVIIKIFNMIPAPARVSLKHNQVYLMQDSIMAETYDDRSPNFSQFEIEMKIGDTLSAEGPSSAVFKIIA